MLQKANRLSKKKDFDRIFNDSKSAKVDCLLVKTAKNNLGQSRFAFVVSKKVSLKAVVRNKVRRRLRAAVSALAGQVKTPTDVIVIALAPIATKEFADISQALTKAFAKLNII